MRTVLIVADFIAVLIVVIGVVREVWKDSRSALFAAILLFLMLCFGTVSVVAATGLASTTIWGPLVLLLSILTIATLTRALLGSSGSQQS